MKFLQKISIKYGLIMTALTGLWLMLMHFTGQYEGEESLQRPLDLAFIVIVPLIVWYFGISERKKQLGGNLTFKQGLVTGVKISLVYALLSPFAYAKYYLFLNSEILEFIGKAYGLSNANNYLIIAIDMGAQFVSAIVGGTVYSAILSFFLRSKTS